MRNHILVHLVNSTPHLHAGYLHMAISCHGSSQYSQVKHILKSTWHLWPCTLYTSSLTPALSSNVTAFMHKHICLPQNSAVCLTCTADSCKLLLLHRYRVVVLKLKLGFYERGHWVIKPFQCFHLSSALLGTCERKKYKLSAEFKAWLRATCKLGASSH